jgi:hypothetical protein
MKKTPRNLADVLVILASIVAAAIAPWWAVWFLALPALYVAALDLINRNTNWIWQA